MVTSQKTPSPKELETALEALQSLADHIDPLPGEVQSPRPLRLLGSLTRVSKNNAFANIDRAIGNWRGELRVRYLAVRSATEILATFDEQGSVTTKSMGSVTVSLREAYVAVDTAIAQVLGITPDTMDVMEMNSALNRIGIENHAFALLAITNKLRNHITATWPDTNVPELASKSITDVSLIHVGERLYFQITKNGTVLAKVKIGKKSAPIVTALIKNNVCTTTKDRMASLKKVLKKNEWLAHLADFIPKGEGDGHGQVTYRTTNFSSHVRMSAD